jgi:hypothetical protein
MQRFHFIKVCKNFIFVNTILLLQFILEGMNMKKILILSITIMLLSVAFASAGFWDGVGEGLQFMLTGAVVGIQEEHESGEHQAVDGEPPQEDEIRNQEPPTENQNDYVSEEGHENNNYQNNGDQDYQPTGNQDSFSCPPEDQGLRDQDKCYSDGGDPRWEYDSNGCSYVICESNDYNDDRSPPGQENWDDQPSTICGDGYCDGQSGENSDWCPQDCQQRNRNDNFQSGFDSRCETKMDQCVESCYDSPDESCFTFCENDFDQCTGGDGREFRDQNRGSPKFGAPDQGNQGSEINSPACPTENQMSEIKEECSASGGNPFIRNDHYRGCAFVECSFGGGRGGFFGGESGCQTEEEANKIVAACESFGQQAWTVPGGPGCEPRIVCKPPENARGYGMGHEEYTRAKDNFEELDATKLLLLVTKFDSLKIQLIGLQERMLEISRFYSDRDDAETSTNYANAASKLQAVIDKIDEQKGLIAEAAASGTVDFDTIVRMKSELRYSIDELMTKVVGAVLGVEVAEPVLTEEDLTCGQDDYCFEELFRDCTVGASFEPEPGVFVSLSGVDENGDCVMNVESEYGSGSCYVPDYQYAILEKESIEPYCDESLQEMFAMEKQMDEQFDDFGQQGAPPGFGAPQGDDFFDDRQNFGGQQDGFYDDRQNFGGQQDGYYYDEDGYYQNDGQDQEYWDEFEQYKRGQTTGFSVKDLDNFEKTDQTFKQYDQEE